MNARRKGIICQIAGVVVGISGLIPTGILLNPWRNAKKATQLDEIYFSTSLIEASLVALVGISACYLLIRFGTRLKQKREDRPNTEGLPD